MTVPSRGVLYNGLLPDGEVTYNPMTGKEEKILAGGSRNGASVIDSILKSCMPDLPVSVDDLLTNDKYFMLLVLRAQSYGSIYKFQVKCESCARKFTHEVNLGFTDTEEEDDSAFMVRVLTADTVEPFETDPLPSSKDVIKFRLLRGKDEKAIQRFAESAAAKGRQSGDPSYIYRLARHLVAVNDKEIDAFEAQAYVENMIGMDSNALRNAIEKADCGVDTTVKAQCPLCDEDNEFLLPMTPEFFRPRS
jgi:hypothetical protein